ncbi:MAG: TIGR00153 family protein [Gemmatimonadota bacterium]|nr:TIGR00153 family protein [Gemmatimonadota bacterium]
MRSTNPIAALFGKSPFRPMQEHMRVVEECAEEVIPLLEALRDRDHERVLGHKDKIFALEGEADDLKNELRSHLPRSLFMPVDRRDLLDLLNAQDSVADTVQDIAGLVVLRGMEIPGFMSDGLLPYARRVVDAVHKCREVISELDELLELGFRGSETARVEEAIQELSVIETETDDQGMALVGLLFEHQDELNALEVVYWDRLIDLIGDIADYAEDVGDRLRLLIAR